MEDRDLHFHDLRGTAATRFRRSVRARHRRGNGWEEEYVEKIIRRHVATKAAIA